MQRLNFGFAAKGVLQAGGHRRRGGECMADLVCIESVERNHRRCRTDTTHRAGGVPVAVVFSSHHAGYTVRYFVTCDNRSNQRHAGALETRGG